MEQEYLSVRQFAKKAGDTDHFKKAHPQIHILAENSSSHNKSAVSKFLMKLHSIFSNNLKSVGVIPALMSCCSCCNFLVCSSTNSKRCIFSVISYSFSRAFCSSLF